MGSRFRNPLTVQGLESGDNRIFHSFEWRDMPIALRWVPADNGGHDGAVSVGAVEEAHLASDDEKKEFGFASAGDLWIGSGEYLDETVPAAAQAAELAKGGAAFFSVDPGGPLEYHYVILDADGGEVSPKDVNKAYDKVFYGEDEDGKAQEWLESLRERIEFDLYTVGGVTQVDIPCFPECRVQLVDAEAAATDRTQNDVVSALRMMRRLAAGPATRPAAWYQKQSYDRYTPYSISDEGQISGHLAGWNACHRGFTSHCEKPDYQTDFDEFHTGWVALDDGARVRVGVLTHVEGHLDSIAAYTRVAEDPACQLGTVRLYSDRYGIQMCGSVHPDVTPAQITRALAGAPSGDWRGPAHARRLYGAAIVNTPGYTAYVADDGEGTTRMVAAIPAPLPLNTEASPSASFFDISTSLLTAACACEASPEAVHEDCGCGSTDECTCEHGLSAEDLLTIAQLDQAMKLRKASAGVSA